MVDTERSILSNPDLDRLFNPTSLAIIGASSDTKKAGARFLKGLSDTGYKGVVYPVNPNYTEVLGRNSYSGVLDLPNDIDLAVVAVPSKQVPGVVAECCRKRVRFVVVHSAGFAELGEEGKQLELEMLRATRDGVTHIVGPNCMGIYVPSSHINMIVYGAPLTNPGGLAFIGQSGWVTENVVVHGIERGLRFSKIVSIGNQSDLTIEDMIAYLTEDDETRVIALYVEGIKKGRQFFSLVREATRKKPVIIWKSGRSKVGARAASSHTGSLAGSSAVYDALADQTGMVQAHDLEELMDLMVGFSCPILPKGKRVAILCESGGGAVSSADTAEKYGLEVPLLSPEARRAMVDTLTGVVPPFAPPTNPVDIVWGPAENPSALFVKCGRIMLAEADAAVFLDYQKFDEGLSRQIARLRDEMNKPILIVPGYVPYNRPGMGILTANGIPAFDTPAKALRVLSEMERYARRENARGVQSNAPQARITGYLSL